MYLSLSVKSLEGFIKVVECAGLVKFWYFRIDDQELFKLNDKKEGFILFYFELEVN